MQFVQDRNRNHDLIQASHQTRPDLNTATPTPGQTMQSYTPENPSTFDVFLAHNSEDKPIVERIAAHRKAREITAWLDIEQLPPGSWFQEVLQSAIRQAKAIAIVLGPNGLGCWQALALRASIEECLNHDKPVIPVLLPYGDKIPDELLFLKGLSCVNFQHTVEESAGLDSLLWGITGKRPESPV